MHTSSPQGNGQRGSSPLFPFPRWLEQEIRSLLTSDFSRTLIVRSYLEQNLVCFQCWRLCKQILEQRLRLWQ